LQRARWEGRSARHGTWLELGRLDTSCCARPPREATLIQCSRNRRTVHWLAATAPITFALTLDSAAMASPDPNCQDQNGVPTDQFSSDVPAASVNFLLSSAQQIFNGVNGNAPFALAVGPANPDQSIDITLPQDVIMALNSLPQFANSPVTNPINVPFTTPLVGGFPLHLDSVSVLANSIAVAPGFHSIVVSFALAGEATLITPAPLPNFHLNMSAVNASVAFDNDPLTTKLAAQVTVTNVDAGLTFVFIPDPITWAAAEIAANAWLDGNVSGMLQGAAQTGLDDFLATPSTQQGWANVVSGIAALPLVTPPNPTVNAIFDGLGSVLNDGSGLAGFAAYPSSIYIDGQGDLCYSGFASIPPEVPSQFGPSGDPCLALRNAAIASNAPSDIAAALDCEQPVCAPLNAASPGPQQFCAQGWDGTPTPVCTAKWSCVSPTTGQTSFSCASQYQKFIGGSFDLVVLRETNGSFSAVEVTPIATPAQTSLVDSITPAPVVTPTETSLTYRVCATPAQAGAPSDPGGTNCTALLSVPFTDCACEPFTCAELGLQCGTTSDGCGGTIACGSCASGKTCSENMCCPIGTTWSSLANACTAKPVTCKPPMADCGGYCCKCGPNSPC
jgi:hypothetical protein